MLSESQRVGAFILLLVVAAGGWYLYGEVSEQGEHLPQIVVEGQVQKNVPEEIQEEAAEGPKKEPVDRAGYTGASLSFKSCVDSLYFSNEEEYNKWEGIFSGLYPDFQVYDAGAKCELSNGYILVSFSYFFEGKDGQDMGQAVALFDTREEFIIATENFHCLTIGDLGYPTFSKIEDNVVTLSCKSGDAGLMISSTYELNMEDFSYALLEEKREEVR